MDLQELIARGRFLFAAAPQRLKVFELVDGRRSTRELAHQTKRHINSVRRDLRLLENAELIRPKQSRDGEVLKKENIAIYEKAPLARTVSSKYFRAPTRLPLVTQGPSQRTKAKKSTFNALPVPNENEILEICRAGEDQLFEFKGQGTDVRKITREIAAMLHGRRGGIIFYGVSDDGTIEGTDVSRQKFDQALQNSIKNQISPAASVRIHSVSVLGNEILIVVVPPWDRRNVYQFEERVLIRKGTNVFAARPEESRRLHKGESIE